MKKPTIEDIVVGTLIFAVFAIIIGFIYYMAFVDRHSHEVYQNINMKIAAIGSPAREQVGKFAHASCTTILLETLNEPIQYVEFDTCNHWNHNIRINNVWLYNRKVGDAVYFKQIRKERFFDIKPEYRTFK